MYKWIFGKVVIVKVFMDKTRQIATINRLPFYFPRGL